MFILKEKCLTNEAHELVKNIDSLDAIWDRLAARYGDNIQIVDAVNRDIQNCTITGQNVHKGLIDFVNILEKGVQDLESIKMEKEISNAYTIRLIEKKLPQRVYLKWLEEEHDDDGSKRFMQLLTFLKEERKRVEKVLMQRDPVVTEKENTKRRGINAATGGYNAAPPPSNTNQSTQKSCLVHTTNGNHHTRKCKKFMSMSVEERGKLVKDLEACVLCLTTSHKGASECPLIKSGWQPCDVSNCGKFHSRMLHGCTIQGLLFHVDIETSNTLLLIQKVPSTKGELVAFFDNGGNISMVTKSYVRKHKLRGVKITYELTTVTGTKNQDTYMYDVPIRDISGEVHIIKAYGIDNICEETEPGDMNEISKLFEGVNANEVERARKPVDLLIGSDYLRLHPKPTQESGNLILYKSRFGTGKLIAGNHELVTSSNNVSSFVKIVAKSNIRNVKVFREQKGVDFFTAESFGVSVPPKCNRCMRCKDCKFLAQRLSRIERKQYNIMLNNLTLDPVSQKWTTTYQFEVDPSVLENNREQVVAMTKKTELRLAKSPDVAAQYCDQFRDTVSRGVFAEVSKEELEAYKGPKWYITHHEVFKEDSASTPVRLVLNSSLRYKGESLNDALMKGPNALNDLWSVQLRFRTYNVALVIDLKKMYQSINTTAKEEFVRLVLWRDMNRNEEFTTYGTKTMNFGDKPAAAISSIALRETAEIYKHIDEVAAKKIQDDSFVDDITTGDKEDEQVDALLNNIKEILSKGGFHVKGAVKSGDKSEENLQLLGTGEIGRVLGVGWDPSEDVFVVRVRINFSKKHKGKRKEPDLELSDLATILNRKVTRRMILTVVMSCYDPYGLLSPITVQLKIELRELYRAELNLGWDDDISQEKKVIWHSILQLLKLAENIRFKRSIFNADAIGDPELLVFCDGSPLAMCSAAFIRWRLSEEEFDIRLIAAKTRVTPLSRMTVPKAELRATVMGVRLCKSVVETCNNMSFKRPLFFSDSRCTLATFSKDSTALNEFTGNSVDEVLNFSDTSQWFHVGSSDNIADIGTKMNAKIEDVQEGSEWQTGPRWLYGERESWPVKQDMREDEVPAESLLVKRKCFATTNHVSILDIEKLAMHTYNFLMRSTARILYALEKKSFKSNQVDLANLDRAEQYWLKESSRLTAIELEKGNLRSLRPQVDDDGVIVTSSRAVEGLKLTYNRDRFPILTSKDPLAHLWMQHVHCEDHSGVTKTVALSRRRYWIVRGGRLASKIRRSCYRCRTLDKELAQQQMAPLPAFRLSPAPVFNVTSIDLFGPLTIRDTVKRRTHMKVWGVIATCASVRAVYLDLTEGYSTDAILQTLRRFVTIHGCPSKMISDQGTQLIAASKDVASLTKDWNWTTVSQWASDNNMEWKFVPAEGQHMNGLSESLIRSVKRSIHHVIGDNILTFSELQVAFFEIANIINSRPIGVTPTNDPEFPQALTPNDLILGRATNEPPQGPFNTDTRLTKHNSFIQELVDSWWKRWYDTVLPSLVPCHKWLQRHCNCRLNNICLIRHSCYGFQR